MDREQFWALIEAARAETGGGCEQQAADLVVALRERSVSEVLDYHHIHSWLMAKSYRMELWGGCLPDQRRLLRRRLRLLPWLAAQPGLRHLAGRTG